jgi:hypothetical protein
MKKLLFSLSLLIGIHTADAQTALGLRPTPDGGGFTGKFFLDNNVAVEAQLNTAVFGNLGRSVSAVALAEYHLSLPNPAWRVYFGGGAHIGAWDRGYIYNNVERKYVSGYRAIVGIDGIGGVEYLFKKIPLGLSADFKPAMNFLSDVDFYPHNMFGVAARVYFK